MSKTKSLRNWPKYTKRIGEKFQTTFQAELPKCVRVVIEDLAILLK